MAETENTNVESLVGIDIEEAANTTNTTVKGSSPISNGTQPLLIMPTIIRVPPAIRSTDAAAYEPELVSIGPYHHGKAGLKPMQEMKRQYLNHLLARNSTRTNLEGCHKAVGEMESQARACYHNIDDMNGPNEFAEMLLLDASFVIEMFLRQREEVRDDDPICGVAWALPIVGEDLLLVENQLPFFVLHNLFLLIFGPSINLPFSLIDLALDFFNHDLLTRSGSRTTTSNKSHVQTAINIESIYHLLHLFHLHLQPSPPPRLQNQPPLILCSNGLSFPRRSSRLWAVRMGGASGTALLASIPSATHLQAAGIKFKLKDGGDGGSSFLDVTFRHGVMEIPRLTIYHWTNSMLRNFIAMEQCFPKLGSHFTSYAYLMDCIVNTAEDVDVLGQKDIIGHWLGSDEEVALLFNGLCRRVNVVLSGNSYLPELLEKVNQYCKDPRHKWRSMLVRNYFKSPWSMISFGAGILAFAITILMALFKIYTYYHDPRVLPHLNALNQLAFDH